MISSDLVKRELCYKKELHLPLRKMN